MRWYLAPRAGLWCRSLSGWDSFCGALAAADEPAQRLAEPVPDLLPSREGRRAPLHVRLGIEAGIQACGGNGVPPQDVKTVFASAAGDIQITDYMCRTLAGPSPMLSPTRFHNSVHNAASGYWSIGAANRLASTAVAAQEYTFPVALLEAATLALTDGGTVLLIAHDVPAPPPLDAVCTARQPFGVGLLLSADRHAADWRPVEARLRSGAARWPVAAAEWLRRLAAENDSARGLPLLEALATGSAFSLALPLGASSSLVLDVGR